MALIDTYVKNIKPSGSAAGAKHSDGQGLYLLVRLEPDKAARTPTQTVKPPLGP